MGPYAAGSWGLQYITSQDRGRPHVQRGEIQANAIHALLEGDGGRNQAWHPAGGSVQCWRLVAAVRFKNNRLAGERNDCVVAGSFTMS